MNDKTETDGKNPGTDPVVNTDSNDKVDIVKEPDPKKDKEKITEIDKKAKNREYHKEYMRNKRKKLKDIDTDVNKTVNKQEKIEVVKPQKVKKVKEVNTDVNNVNNDVNKKVNKTLTDKKLIIIIVAIGITLALIVMFLKTGNNGSDNGSETKIEWV